MKKNKKLLISLISAIMSISCILPAFAYENVNNGENKLDEYTIKKIIEKANIPADSLQIVAAVFTADSKLYSASPVDLSKPEQNLTYPDGEYILKLYYNIGSDLYFSISSKDIKSINDELTEALEQENNNNIENNEKTQSGSDAIIPSASSLGAIAMVKEVNEIFDDNDQETKTSVDFLYNGEDITVNFDTDFTLTASEGSFSYMNSQPVSSLEEGDLVSFKANLSGKLTGVVFLFRAPEEDAVFNEEYTSLMKLTSKTAVFGIITKRYANNTFILYDSTGLSEGSLDISIDKNTKIYCYDASKKSNKIYNGTVSDIEISELSKSDYDDNDNITVWDTESERSYAYVRMYDGDVCEIAVYMNYSV